MRIIYIHQYYLTPGQGGAIRSYHLTQGMSAEGFTVEVITAHNGKNYGIRWDGKVKVHLLPVAYDNKFNTIQRLWSFYSFVRQAKSLINKEDLPDLFFITSTPLSTGEIGIWARKKWGIPFVFEVRDLWPEAPVQVKQIQNRLLKKWLYGLEYKIYRKASGIVALSPGIQNYVKKLVPEKGVELVPNFSDTDFFSRKEMKTQSRDFVSQPLTLLYAGAIGQVNGLYQYLELAAAATKHGKNWRFQLMGKGNQLEALKRDAKAKALDRVEFLSYGDKAEVRERMKKADFAYISFLPLKVLELSSPNKFFDALAMGLPVVVNFKGWIWEMIEGNGIGFYHDCFNHESLIASLENLENSPQLMNEMNLKARKLAEVRFDKHLMISRILKIVKGLGNPSGSTSPGLVP